MDRHRRLEIAETCYQDIVFDQRCVAFPGPYGEQAHKWVDVGMPLVPNAVTSGVFYLYRLMPNGKLDPQPRGTGFIISVPPSDPSGFAHLYAISNWHIVSGCVGASIIRLNRQDGSTRLIELDPSEWIFFRDGDDLAIAPIELFPEYDLVSTVPQSLFLTRESIKRHRIGLGEDVFMIGLFVGHDDGATQNFPKARFGNISMIADERAPVEQPNRVEGPCHIVDMRSRTGFSGSPVFAYRLSHSDLGKLDAVWDGNDDLFYGLLGVHCGQFLEPLEVRRLREQMGEATGDPIRESDMLRVESSMTIVVPAWSINKLLEHPKLVEKRKKDEQRRRNDFRPKAEAVVSAVARDGEKANPAHKEDFTRLLNEAARKREREAGT